MSLKLVFSVYDSKAEAFLQPIFCATEGIAFRLFSAAVNDRNHDFHKFAEDYTLFQIGVFDEQDGRLEALQSLKSVCTAIAIRKEV